MTARSRAGARAAASLRGLPSVDALLRSAPLQALAARVPRAVLVSAARQAVTAARGALRAPAKGAAAAAGPPDVAAIATDAASRAEAAMRPSLRPVLNATGVVIHTNLGRAPLAEDAVRALAAMAGSYTNLEFDLARGERGSRMSHLEPLLREILGAPAALVVNNNAAAMILAINTFARGKEAVVSRGELVEIGGSFRIPEILERAGATLREVGTTNKTRIGDYERALGPATGAILRIHPSNFAIVGFTAEVPREELVRLARRRKIPLIEDVGSGALVDMTRFGLPDEPLAARALA